MSSLSSCFVLLDDLLTVLQIIQIEEERRKRSEKRVEKPEEKEELIPVELDSFPVRDHKEGKAPSPAPTPPPPTPPPVKQRLRSPVAFEIRWVTVKHEF